MYREPGRPDKYVIEERVVVNRILKLPSLPKLPKWMAPMGLAIISPFLCGIVYRYVDGGLCIGAIASLGLFGLVCLINGIAKAEP